MPEGHVDGAEAATDRRRERALDARCGGPRSRRASAGGAASRASLAPSRRRPSRASGRGAFPRSTSPPPHRRPAPRPPTRSGPIPSPSMNGMMGSSGTMNLPSWTSTRVPRVGLGSLMKGPRGRNRGMESGSRGTLRLRSLGAHALARGGSKTSTSAGTCQGIDASCAGGAAARSTAAATAFRGAQDHSAARR